MTAAQSTADPTSLSAADIAKRAAAARALDFVEPGMTLGLGTGSTAAWFIRLLSERIRETGLPVTGIATSNTTLWLARELGIPVREIDTAKEIDLTVDGADEIDGHLNLIKGGGAALLKEKIVATASARMIVIADQTKIVSTLGAFPLPVEVVKFGHTRTQQAIEEIVANSDVDGTSVVLRQSGNQALVTDEGHHILDLHLGRIGDLSALAQNLARVPGVVDHGLFIGIAESVIIGRQDGTCDVIDRPAAAENASR
ncbi:MAG: ribose-5-phosphate isomerase RpiA [Pseudomonadota bacterium]